MLSAKPTMLVTLVMSVGVVAMIPPLRVQSLNKMSFLDHNWRSEMEMEITNLHTIYNQISARQCLTCDACQKLALMNLCTDPDRQQ